MTTFDTPPRLHEDGTADTPYMMIGHQPELPERPGSFLPPRITPETNTLSVHADVLLVAVPTYSRKRRYWGNTEAPIVLGPTIYDRRLDREYVEAIQQNGLQLTGAYCSESYRALASSHNIIGQLAANITPQWSERFNDLPPRPKWEEQFSASKRMADALIHIVQTRPDRPSNRQDSRSPLRMVHTHPDIARAALSILLGVPDRKLGEKLGPDRDPSGSIIRYEYATNSWRLRGNLLTDDLKQPQS